MYGDDVSFLVSKVFLSQHRKEIEGIANLILIKLRKENQGFSDEFLYTMALSRALDQIELVETCVTNHTPTVVEEHWAEIEAIACTKMVNLYARAEQDYSPEFLAIVTFFAGLHEVLNLHVHNPEVYKKIMTAVLMAVSGTVKMEGKTPEQISDLIYRTAYNLP